MIKGLGVDIVKINRISRLINKWGDKFLNRVFTEKEIAYCQNKIRTLEHFSVRFAAKEAFIKMLGTGKGLSWLNIEIRNNAEGKPEIKISGKALVLSRNMGIKKIHISMSHEREYALAQVIGED
jgi:holo-[acyl-carrier protein] synthase